MRKIRLSARPIPWSGLVWACGAMLSWAVSGEATLGADDPTKARSRPNIVLAMADDQGWGDVGYNSDGLVKTPVLDEMAQVGVRFNRFYAAAPVCSPTRGSVLTGRHPNRFACFSWGHTLRPQEVTLAEELRKHGYRTGHFGKWHLGPLTESSPISPTAKGFDEWMSSPNFFENDPLFSHKGKTVRRKGESSMTTVDAALDFIGQAVEQKQPFFAVVWFGSPHTPHVAQEAELNEYPDLAPKLRHYRGELTGIDRAMGKLRSELRRLGAADDTLVWYTSDNGAAEPGSTGGLAGKKGTLWEGGLRVPGLIEWPARYQQPQVVETPCGTVDIFPTVLDLVGVKPSSGHPLDGQSLAPMLDGKGPKTREKPLGFWVYPIGGRPVRSGDILKAAAAAAESGAEAEQPFPKDPGDLSKRYDADEFGGPAAWIDGDYKLLVDGPKNRKGLGKAAEKADGQASSPPSLYNLKQDPAETKNLADAEPERVVRMTAELQAWQKSVVGSLNGQDYSTSKPQP